MKMLVAGETVVKFETEKGQTSAAVCHAHFGELVEVQATLRCRSQ